MPVSGLTNVTQHASAFTKETAVITRHMVVCCVAVFRHRVKHVTCLHKRGYMCSISSKCHLPMFMYADCHVAPSSSPSPPPQPCDPVICGPDHPQSESPSPPPVQSPKPPTYNSPSPTPDGGTKRGARECEVDKCTSAYACETATCLTAQHKSVPACPKGARCEQMKSNTNLCVYTPRPMGYTCYTAKGKCDRDIKCNGVSGQCPVTIYPAVAFKPAGTICHKAAGSCEVDVRCTGKSVDCPSDRSPPLRFAPMSQVCYKAAGECEKAITCTGSSAACPTESNPKLKYKPAGAVCREAKGTCGVVSTCTGMVSTCPFPESHGRAGYTYKCNDKIWCHGPRKDVFKKHRGGKGWDIGGCEVGNGSETLEELDSAVGDATKQVDWAAAAPTGKGGPPPKWGHQSHCTPANCPNGGKPREAVFLVCKCNIDNANDPCNWTYYESVSDPPQEGAAICPRKPFYNALD